MHRSPHQGRSIEFSQHREYVPGDDLRQVDWKVYGRTDKFYLKQYEAETNLICHVLLDGSESMSYKGPSSSLSKLEYAQLTAVSFAYLVLSQQDAVSMTLLADQVIQQITPSNSPAQLNNVIGLLDSPLPKRATSLEPALKDAASRLKSRGVVVLISDFLDDANKILQGLQHLRYQRHDIVMVHILDEAEVNFPFDQTSRFNGLEGWDPIVADPQSLRAAYKKEVESHIKKLREGARSLEVDYQLMLTDQPLHLTLPHLLAQRRRRQ
ncbi:MAG: DUF58 domain-containing protein [Planctomycetes bacterium]|nr:DUF58 domain-containing protein [Planctomycetota bacterium]